MSAAISTAAKMEAAHFLLGRADCSIRANVSSLIECSSDLAALTPAGDMVPIPGTIEPQAAAYIARLVNLLRDIEEFIGEPLEAGPSWLDDILARRNGWEDAI